MATKSKRARAVIAKSKNQKVNQSQKALKTSRTYPHEGTRQAGGERREHTDLNTRGKNSQQNPGETNQTMKTGRKRTKGGSGKWEMTKEEKSLKI